MGKLDGKVAIVTGASSGIGLATAIAFAEEGAKVTLTGRNRERLADAATKCREAGSETLEILGDMSDLEHLPTIIDKTIDKFGNIDVLVNNAATGSIGPFGELTLEVYEDIFNTNLRAPVFLTQRALPYLTKTKGCIVNVSSLAAMKPSAGVAAYAMSKAALDHFARCLAAEYAPAGVRVNNVSPAAVRTRFMERVAVPDEIKQQLSDQLKEAQVLGIIKSEQVAEAILFLASAEMMTGGVLPIDAGLLVAQP